MPVQIVIGLMSGTSMDGVDAAVLETDGETIAGHGPRLLRPYSEAERDTLRQAAVAARSLTDRSARPGILADAERIVTAAHAEAVERLLQENPGLKPDLIGFHGQTVFHDPKRQLTVQLGDGPALAKRLGVAVVYDFRAADVAAGGEGAPFVPVYHRALALRTKRKEDIAVINIGGVANLTRIGKDDSLTAGDIGPGNALIDDFVRARTGKPMDHDGELARNGRIDQDMIDRFLSDPWFDLPLPKSLDRDAFSEFALSSISHLSAEAGAATLTALTAEAVGRGIRLAGHADLVVVAGGGAHNPVLLDMLGQETSIPITTAADLGWSIDFLEAEAFAYLAARSVAGLPLSYPGTTGVPEPMTGGVLVRP